MNVTISPPVALTLQVLGDDDRRRVSAWIDHLGNWENDPHVQHSSKRLPGDDNVFVLRTSTDIRIFFTIRGNTIVILDIARQDSIDRFNNLPVEKASNPAASE